MKADYELQVEVIMPVFLLQFIYSILFVLYLRVVTYI
jgi:hypothetical protein